MEFRIAKMPIHGLRTAQERMKCITSNCDHQGQTNWSPHGIPSPHPIGKTKDARRINAKFAGFIGRRR